MYCSRVDHFIRIVPGNRPIRPCCHMVDPPSFTSVDAMHHSDWIIETRNKFLANKWPIECKRCMIGEQMGIESPFKLAANAHEDLKSNPNYKVVSITSDITCNGACQICSTDRSTLLAKLTNTPVNIFDTMKIVRSLPKDEVKVIELSGGEVGVSVETLNFLSKEIYEFNVDEVVLTTNGSRAIQQVEKLLLNGKRVSVGLSMDGVDRVFEYTRWPLKWSKFQRTVEQYLDMQNKFPALNLCILNTVNALSIVDIDNIVKFSTDTGIQLFTPTLNTPSELTIQSNNQFTRYAKEKFATTDNELIKSLITQTCLEDNDSSETFLEFVRKNDTIRGIAITDYYQKEICVGLY